MYKWNIYGTKKLSSVYTDVANNKKMKILHKILMIILIGFSSQVKADFASYSDSLRLRVESDNYVIIHFHDWTINSKDKRYEMISTHQDPFTDNNDYSYIECIDKRTDSVIFRKPCPALTKIKISEDEGYIIGISKIKLWNPIHLVVFDTKGVLIKKRHISPQEAKLSISDYATFKLRFPSEYAYLDSINRVYNVGDSVFIDFLSMGMPKRLGDAWSYLYDFSAKNHLSDNFNESVTNWIFWFNDKNQDIRFENKDNQFYSISLLDYKGQRIEIPIDE
jgi:hypothetical protein